MTEGYNFRLPSVATTADIRQYITGRPQVAKFRKSLLVVFGGALAVNVSV